MKKLVLVSILAAALNGCAANDPNQKTKTGAAIGAAAYNMQLSERRAESVVDYFINHGVSSDRLFASGRGESEPRASNDTEAGRQLNRRVEIFVKPVVEGQESEAYKTP